MSWNDDQYILSQFRIPQSREKAFTELVKKYQETLYSQIRRMVHDHESTHDVLQNVFIKVWKYLDSFREDSKLSTWLFRIAVNESLSWLENEEKRSTYEVAKEENSKSDSITPSTTQIEQKLELAIKSLPPKQRMVFILRYFEEKTYEEISELVETSVGALKASYHHAVKKIEDFIKDH
ncbi:MAG: RNA polymerase sigma factor [Sphingobacteriales bacterium]|jgi:RNA polymerase sigma factor (sigma-70 family)